jgi:GT2 family glycosyltransferase
MVVSINFWIKTYFFPIFSNPKKIPIIIISFNQLHYLRKLIDFLLKYKYTNIVIIDNNSTYEPLLDYFDTIKSSVTIHRLSENYGHLVFWQNKELFDRYSKGYYVVTDADIVPHEDCPGNFVQHFRRILDKNPDITKVGFSLKMDDIPIENLHREKILKWESNFYNNKKAGYYVSQIDTTFALYRPNYKSQNIVEFLNAIRVDTPYIARHGGWYVNFDNLTNEQRFYISTANESSSWLSDEMGRLINPGYKDLYKN